MELLDKEHYVNIIELLKLSLEFYAEKQNYVGDETKVSNIELDQGEQARFTLKSVESIFKQTQAMGDNLDELLKGVNPEDNSSAISKLFKNIEELKKHGNQI